MPKVLNTISFFTFPGSGPQYQPPNIFLTFLKESVELFRIQIKTQTFLYYFFLLQQILKFFGAALLFDLFEFQIWSCQNLSQRLFLFIYIVFNQNYIITHEHSLLFKAQHIICTFCLPNL